MYRTGPQLVQSVGVGVLAEQQHSIGHQLPYKQCGTSLATTKTIYTIYSCSLGQLFLGPVDSWFPCSGDPMNTAAFQKLPRSLLISWCLTPQAGAVDLVPENPSVTWS